MRRPYAPDTDRVLAGLYRHRDGIEARREAALAAMARYGTDNPEDWDRYDRAAAEHDRCSDELAPIADEIADIEDGQAREYERQIRSDYYASR